MTNELESVALTRVADGQGILAAEETVHTLTQRFDTLRIQSTEKSRCPTVRCFLPPALPSPSAAAARQALYQCARANSAASLGSYRDEMEETPVSVASPSHRHT